MNFDGVGAVLDGGVAPESLAMEAGALVLFRGRDAMHRVTTVEGERTRMLVVLAYNSEPGISLSESARMNFYTMGNHVAPLRLANDTSAPKTAEEQEITLERRHARVSRPATSKARYPRNSQDLPGESVSRTRRMPWLRVGSS